MNSHIRAGRFRGGGGIGNRDGNLAKRIMRRDYYIKNCKCNIKINNNSSTLANYPILGDFIIGERLGASGWWHNFGEAIQLNNTHYD